MNDPDEILPDHTLERLFAPLRAEASPVDVQRKNRQAIREALLHRLPSPWWRRSVAIPIPVAIAASLALVVAVALSLRPALAQTADSSMSRQKIAPVEYTPDNPGWQFTRSYILSIESFAQDRRALLPAATEVLDES